MHINPVNMPTMDCLSCPCSSLMFVLFVVCVGFFLGGRGVGLGLFIFVCTFLVFPSFLFLYFLKKVSSSSSSWLLLGSLILFCCDVVMLSRYARQSYEKDR